jgi:hypothetical protein
VSAIHRKVSPPDDGEERKERETMTTASLSQIIGTAVIDVGFRSTLLNSPKTVLAQFNLEANELREIASIRATTIEQFAEQLITWMNEHEIRWE